MTKDTGENKVSKKNISRRTCLKYLLGLGLGCLLPWGAVHQAEADKLTEREALAQFGINLHYPSLAFGDMSLRQQTSAIVVHHLGFPDGHDASAAEVHNFHRNQGWAGIGYHYLIHRDGTVEKCRPVEMEGAHCYQNNGYTVGICVGGNFEIDQPSKAQMEVLAKMLSAMCLLYDIKPGSRTIRGHQEYNKTKCPGKNLQAKLPQLRIRTSMLLDQARSK